MLVAGWFDPDLALYAGLAAFFGHIFPVWLNFRGGKGVATYLGVLVGLHWPAALAFVAAWLGVAFMTRFSSLAALIAALVVPVFLYFLGYGGAALLFVVMTAIVYYKHRANISRLMAGTEARIGAKE